MDPKETFVAMLDMNRKTFEQAFNAMEMAQSQYERTLDRFFSQADWLPDEGRKLMDEWFATFKKGRDQYHGALQDGYDKVKQFLLREEHP